MKNMIAKPVKTGDVIQLTVLGVSGKYMTKIDADDVMSLRVEDLELVEEANT